MMEVQMGVGEPLDLGELAARISPYTVGSSPERAYIRAVTGAKFAWYFARLERNVSAFRAARRARRGLPKAVAKVVREATGILVTYRTDPGWMPVFGAAQALLVERGSPLTQAAIVARKIGIPTIVQIPGLTQQVKTGMRLKVDGHSGRIEVLETKAALPRRVAPDSGRNEGHGPAFLEGLGGGLT